ncbi:hypothetical protein [Halothiobacillus sp. DCM-1]|uniref:hypothetical protein n=1 Tax=Halothiobacillus sp. DCM-1 TaxID=3112558 RepID=UPI0032463316
MRQRPATSRWLLLAAFVLSAGRVQAEALPPVIDEASGLIASGITADRYWTHNDNINLPASSRRSPPRLFAIRSTGALLGSLTLTGVQQRDWEGISQARLDGRSTLIVGDIGDNRNTWPDYRLWFVPEPTTLGDQVPTAPSAVLRFRYPDQQPAPQRPGGFSGGHDAEALAIDAATGQALILTKREKPARLFAVPLDARTALSLTPSGTLSPPLKKCPVITATPLATLPPLPAPSLWQQLLAPWIAPYADQPTDLAISPNGRIIALLSYSAIYYFTRQPGQSWNEVFRQPAAIDALPSIEQWEGLSFSPDGRQVLVVREGSGNDALQIRPVPAALPTASGGS